jgi:hypothetical protein
VQHFQCKRDRRNWTLLLLRPSEATEDACRVLAEDAEQADLLVILAPDEAVRKRCGESVRRHTDDWEARFLTVLQDPGLPVSLQVPCLLVGPKRLIERFCRSFKVRGETPDSNLNTGEKEILDGKSPELPDPSEVPRFPEEQHQDPFGQNANLQHAAWTRVAGLVGRMAKIAHLRGRALTLPPPPPGYADIEMKPWRTVVSLDPDAADLRAGELAGLTAQSGAGERDTERGLDLIQRCLLTCAALAGGQDSPDWGTATAILESLGYLLVSKGIDIESCPDLVPFFEIGARAGMMHDCKVLHGDMHPGNFGFRWEERGLGDRAAPLDPDTMCRLSRPLTPLERAKDLTILKLRCTFPQWEAAKLGYRFRVGDIAEQVFQLL